MLRKGLIATRTHYVMMMKTLHEARKQLYNLQQQVDKRSAKYGVTKDNFAAGTDNAIASTMAHDGSNHGSDGGGNSTANGSSER